MNGMDDNEDDDTFSDGAFDDLAPNTLLELETNALQATQKAPRAKEASSYHGRASHGYGLHQNRNSSFRDGHPRRISNVRSQNLQEPGVFNEGYGQDVWDTDAGVATPTDEKESLRPPADRYSEVIQREQWRANRFGQTSGKFQDYQTRPDSAYAAQNPSRLQSNTITSQHRTGAQRGSGNQTAYPSNEDVMLLDDGIAERGSRRSIEEETLRAQIEDLLRDRELLSRELRTSNDEVMKQRGEISIIRSNQEKTYKTFDRQVAALKKSIEEDALKHQGDLEAKNAESQRVVNDNQFLRHNLSEEVERVKNLQRKLKERANETRSPVTTPKKSRNLPLRDGFDDQELAVKSPVKGTRRSGPTTPSAGNKRKRKPTVNSPAPALELSPGIVNGSDEPMPDVESNEAPTVNPVQTVILQDSKGLEFMQKVLNHKVGGSRQRMLELFINFSFPSEKGKLFSSIFLERTAGLAGPTLPVDLTKVILSLWSQSLNEKYHTPLWVFTDVVCFILAIDPVAIAPHTIEDIVKVLQRTAELNGIQRFNHSPVSHLTFGKLKQTPKSSLVDVDETACLEMLFTVACACSHTLKHLAHFWQTVSSDFILMMLNSSQLIANITLTLHLLSTSILPTTFGVIVASEADQAAIEKYILDRVTYLLWETPQVDEGSAPYTRSEICTLRIEAMSLLSALAFSSPHAHSTTSHGSHLLAHHATAIARIFRSMYDELSALYAHPPSRALHSALVNAGTRIVYQLLRLHGDSPTFNLSQKLASINGGLQKHRVVLTRLAFSEGLLLESGIEDESVVMAHEMLEGAVTPEEAEALMDVFPGSRGGGE